MKKFLDLKKSIVQSKNQSTQLQTYLDSLRSSCYKLATPSITPRIPGQHFISPSMLPINNKNINNVENKAKGVNFENSHCNKRANLVMKGNEEKNKKMTYRYNLSDFMQSTEDSQYNQDTYKNAIINHANASIYTFTEYKEQIQQIFQTLSSHCKSYYKNNQKQPFKSQKQIIQTILNNLNMLSQNKQYHHSIQLIKNIIQGMSDGHEINNKYIDIENHSQAKKINYILQTPEGDEYRSLENSHFKSCMEYRNEKQDNICKENINNGISRSENVNKNKNIALKIDWFNPIKNVEGINNNFIPLFENQKILKQHSTQKYNQNIYQLNDNQTIYRQDSPSDHSHNTLYPQTQQYLDSSMKSQDDKQWAKDQLYCISQHEQQEQDQKSLTQSSVIPQQTIEFKKILYMLDSGNTNKKTSDYDHNNMEINSTAFILQPHYSKNNLSNHSQTLHKQKLSKIQQIQSQNYNTTQKQNSSKTVILKCCKNSTDFNNQHNESLKTKTHGKINVKLSELIGEKAENRKNSGGKFDKSKGLQEIVNMLNTKYNCAVKLTK